MTQERLAKAGKLLCVTEGAYSNYGVVGFFVVLHDFEPALELAAYLEAQPEQKEHYNFKGGKMLAWLLAKGLLLEIEYGTLHLQDYDSATEFNFQPAPSET